MSMESFGSGLDDDAEGAGAAIDRPPWPDGFIIRQNIKIISLENSLSFTLFWSELKYLETLKQTRQQKMLYLKNLLQKTLTAGQFNF